MNTLRIGRRVVGSMTSDGNVFAQAMPKGRPIGHVTSDGLIRDSDGILLGNVERHGTVFDASQSPVGQVNSQGSVERFGKPFGTVQGDDPQLAGAALVLLFSERVIEDNWKSERRPVSPLAGCITVSIIGLIAMVALAFALATALVWAGMLILTLLTTMLLAASFCQSLSGKEAAAVSSVMLPTRRGVKEFASDTSLRPFLRYYPNLFVAMAPALWYGIVIGAVTLYLSDSRKLASDIAVVGIAYGIGAVLSLLAARKLLGFRLNSLLLARQKATTASASVYSRWGLTREKLSRLAAYAANVILVTLLAGGIVVGRHGQMPGTKTIDRMAGTGESAASGGSPGGVDTAQPPKAFHSTYEGNTGSKKAIFALDWDETTKKIQGHYFTLEKPERRYVLVGTNPREGVVLLEEFTDGIVSAKFQLKKSIAGGIVTWAGTIFNTDGRKIPVTMRKTKSE